MDTAGGNPSILLQNGSRQEIDKQNGRLDVLTFASTTLDLSGSSRNEETRYRDATEMSLGELFQPDAALNARDAGKFVVEANRRLSAPLTAFSFIMIGLFSVLEGSFRRYGNVMRPLMSVLAVVGLLALGLACQSLAARSPVLMPLIWIHALLPGLVSAWLLFTPALLRRPTPARVRA